MSLRELILKEHSRNQCMLIETWVGKSQKRFTELFQLYTSVSDKVVSQRAGWPLLNCVRKNPAMITRHVPALLQYLQLPDLHQACRRNGFGILETADLPEPVHGDVLNLCFAAMESHDESIAAKANALGVLIKLASLYPDINEEIRLLVQSQQQPLAPALKSRPRKYLG